MKETNLWGKLRPALNYLGTFQKISDRFTPGVPDVLGVYEGRGFALELKEVSGVEVLRVKFRPNQLDWLEDWEKSGGASWLAITHGQQAMFLHWSFGQELESEGMSPKRLDQAAHYRKTKDESFRDFCERFLEAEQDHTFINLRRHLCKKKS